MRETESNDRLRKEGAVVGRWVGYRLCPIGLINSDLVC